MRVLIVTAVLLLGLPAFAQKANPPPPGPQSPPPQAAMEPQRPPGPFDQGRVRVGLSGGTSGSSSNRYFVIGAGVGYFVVDGLEVGLEVESWLGGDPTITKLSPNMRFIFFMVPYVHPYVGGFYRHWFVGDNQDDIDTLGGRAGLALVTSPHLFAGGGVVHEVIISECETDCSETYPEFFVSLAF